MSFAPDNAWVELAPPVYPEGDYVAVHCHKCGAKNRQDDGWRYRDDPVQRAAEEAALHRMGSSREHLRMMIWSMESFGRRAPELARLTYQCDQCRDDRQTTPVQAKAETETSDAVAFHTRSRTATRREL